MKYRSETVRVSGVGRRFLIACAVSVWCVFTPPARASGDRDPPEAIAELPFATTFGMPIITITVDSSRALRCILDTGMVEGVLLLDPAMGSELGLQYVGNVSLVGTGAGSMAASMAMGSTVGVGDLTFDNQRVIVINEDSEFARSGIDAVIGATLFNEFAVQVDSDSGLVSLFGPTEPVARPGDEALAMEIILDKPYVDVGIVVTDGDPVLVSVLLDTGAGCGVSLNHTMIEALRPPSETVETALATGVGGTVHGKLGRIDALQLGGKSLRNVIADFPDGADGGNLGTLGMDVLGRFSFVVDYPNGRLLLRDRVDPDYSFEFNMAGLVLRPMEGGRLRVQHVVSPSPAEAAGIVEGDLLLGVDGQPLRTDDGWLRRVFERDGSTVDLLIERDSLRLHKTITLRRLI